jgi:hypothetical protein
MILRSWTEPERRNPDQSASTPKAYDRRAQAFKQHAGEAFL